MCHSCPHALLIDEQKKILQKCRDRIKRKDSHRRQLSPRLPAAPSAVPTVLLLVAARRRYTSGDGTLESAYAAALSMHAVAACYGVCIVQFASTAEIFINWTSRGSLFSFLFLFFFFFLFFLFFFPLLFTSLSSICPPRHDRTQGMSCRHLRLSLRIVLDKYTFIRYLYLHNVAKFRRIKALPGWRRSCLIFALLCFLFQSFDTFFAGSFITDQRSAI